MQLAIVYSLSRMGTEDWEQREKVYWEFGFQ